MTIGDALTVLRKRSGLTLDQIAVRANYRGRSSVQKFFAAEYDPPYLDMVVAGRLARALVGEGKPPIREDEVFALTQTEKNELDRYRYLDHPGLQRDVPVYPAAYVHRSPLQEGGEAKFDFYMIDLDNPVFYAWHPPAIENRGGVSGIVLDKGAPMPRYKPGEYIFADIGQPPRIGDDVLVFIYDYDHEPDDELDHQPRSSAVGFIATLFGYAGEGVVFSTIDGAKVEKLKISTVKEMQRLLTLSDCLIP
ncbi:helix-turn-helix domain-containing protein [Sphingomonas sp. Root720]|uniref:helix-turn-helix domain-containing protein n=1 Tax=Sphingomonas sp. Root720 TaxID=1736595 RepID=UPI0012E3C6A8|nr:helix-turn-helix transcriptional regulator [Sphingomonas sp. Root720]